MNIPNGFKLVPVEPTEEMLDVIRAGGYSWHLYSNLLAAAPTPPQPIYAEEKERELFEASRNSHTVRRNEHGDYVLPSAQDAWSGWSQCAKSLAKAGEVGHE